MEAVCVCSLHTLTHTTYVCECVSEVSVLITVHVSHYAIAKEKKG